MFKIKDSFKNRTIGFYLSFGAACVALMVAFVYLIVAATKDMSVMKGDNQIVGFDRTFSLAGFLVVVIGALTEIFVVFTDLKFAPIIPAAVIAVGLSLTFGSCLYTLLDIVNGIDFYGGNTAIAFAVPIMLAVSIVVMCVSNFMDMRKAEN